MADYDEDEVSLNSEELNQFPPLRSATMRDSTVSSMKDSGLTMSGRPPGNFLSPPLSMKQKLHMRKSVAIFDDKAIQEGYASVPLVDIDMLPRGGISFETKAVGRIQVSCFRNYFSRASIFCT